MTTSTARVDADIIILAASLKYHGGTCRLTRRRIRRLQVICRRSAPHYFVKHVLPSEENLRFASKLAANGIMI